MARAKRVCARPGCPIITEPGERWCASDKPKPWSTHGAGQGRGRPWRRQRWACFERDDFTCQDPGCGHRDPTGKTIEADHIGPTDDLEDLLTRCKSHHLKHTLDDAAKAREGR